MILVSKHSYRSLAIFMTRNQQPIGYPSKKEAAFHLVWAVPSAYQLVTERPRLEPEVAYLTVADRNFGKLLFWVRNALRKRSALTSIARHPPKC